MKKLGFGCMRLPMIGGEDGEVDQSQFEEMIDRFMAVGFCYFDTAHVYLDGKSELALRECLVKRYPRDSFILTNKLSGTCFRDEAEIDPLFRTQLAACGVEYFDYYLMHSLTARSYDKFTACHAFDRAAEYKARGSIRHMGISFHDKPEVLDRILSEHPEIEVVQIQLNYFDYDSPSIQSGALYNICEKHQKPVLVMEPVRGGALAALPPAAEAVFSDLHGGSPASYAIRYAASFPQVVTVLSGMSTLAQMEDNLSFMADFRPLSEAEQNAVSEVCSILKAENSIQCTGCRYCTAGCPMSIPIPDLFACLNTERRYHDWGSGYYYGVSTRGKGKASDCIRCRRCESICPQHLPVSELLKQVADAFETGNNTD